MSEALAAGDKKLNFLLSYRTTQTSKSTKRLRSHSVQQKKTFLMKFVMLSVDNGPWKFLQIQAVVIRYVLTTYSIGFHQTDWGFITTDMFNLVLDLFYIVDLFSAIVYRYVWPTWNKRLQQNASYLSRLVWRNAIFRPRQYWMIAIDIFSLAPLEALTALMPFQSVFHSALHVAPALRIYRVPVYYASEFSRISLRIHSLMTLFIKIVLFWAVTTHTITCFWGWIFQFNYDFSTTHFAHRIIFDREDRLQWYFVINYFIQIAFTNIGFGDVYPLSDLERVMTIFTLICGFVFLFGYLIGVLSLILMEKVRRLTHLQFRLSLMTFELESKRVPEAVSKRIIKFFYSLWASRKGIGPVNELLLTLPDSFSTLVYYDIFKPALNASLLFRNCDSFSKRAIAKAMKIQLFMAGDVILKRREYNYKLFYIRKGTIQIMSYQDDETEVMTFGAGTVFGQVSLMLCLPTKSEVHAATFCEIHTISRKKLFKVLMDYPMAKVAILEVFENLLLNVMADKYNFKKSKKVPMENVITSSNFYKIPVETSKLARDDICVVSKCPYVFMPDTIFLRSWNLIIAIIVIIICFYYPYEAAFERRYPTRMEPFIILVDVFFLFNMYITFSTAFVHQNILFSSLRDIIAAKLTTISGCLDIIALLPIHYFLDDSSRLKPVFLCLRCLMFYKIHLLFRTAECTAGLTTIFILRLMKYILYFLFGAYVMGIIYYMEACYNDPCIQDSWYEAFGAVTKTISSIWVSVYYATVIMTCTGYGDITVGNITDIFYVICFAVFGVLLFIYLISEYSANLSLRREPRQMFVELAARVNTFLLSQKMLRSERTRVRQFLNLQWERNKGYEFTFNYSLFSGTPANLLYNANQYTKSRGVQKLKLFKGMGDQILGSILNTSFRRVYPPHEVVIYAGDICQYMMVIEEGFCEVTYGKDVSITKVVHAGQDICTVELMLGLTSLCHVRTLTHCVIMEISILGLKRAFALNPVAARELDESIAEFKNSPELKLVLSNRPIFLHLTVRSTVQKSLYRFRYYRKQSGNKELSEPYLKLGLCQWIRFLLRSTTVLPYGKFLKRWESSRCVFAFMSAMLFPCIPYLQLQFKALYYLGVILDSLCFVDMYFRFHICYYNSRHILVSHPLWTCSHYMKGNFVFDFIFCFPFDRVMFRPYYDVNGYALVTTPAINLLRIFRVGQVYRIPARLNTYGVDFLSSPHLYWVILTECAMTTVFINLMTSILILTSINYRANAEGDYFIEYESNNSKKHFEALFNKFHFPTEPIYVFIMNFYWTCVTAFGIGFGDITADTSQLMIYVITVLVISYLYFNYVTVIIASNLTGINMNLTTFQKRMSHLVSYLKVENVEPLLRTHIVNHFEYIWKKNKAMKAQYVFYNFNTALRDDVMFHLYEETIRGVTAFSNLDASFHRHLSSRLDEIYFQSGAAIYKPGDILSQLYIIHQGEVTLVGKDENETVELGRSKVFGIFENVSQSAVTVSAVATKNVTVLAIDAVELYQILESVERGMVEHVQDEKAKLTKALKECNTVKADLEEEPQNFGIKIKSGFAYLIYRFSRYILIFYVIVSLYSVNLVSYILAFQYNSKVIMFSVIMVEFLFLVKLYLGFNTGYMDEFGEIVSDRRLIRMSYVRTTGFYIDLITLIPVGFFALLASNQNQSYIASWLKVVKLLRLYNVWYFFNLKYDTLSVNVVMLKIIAVGVWTGTLLHQCTCMWFLVSCPRADCRNSETWKSRIDNYDYLNSLYFIVVVLTTTGFGDMTPHTLSEIIFVTTLFFVSFFYTAIFIGEMVSMFQKSLFAKTNYEFEVEELKNYLHFNDVPYDTKKVIFTYVKNLWRNERGQQIPELLKNAPRYLTNEIKLSTYGHHINDNPIFKNCSVNFRKQIINLLWRTIFYAQDIIAFEGEVNRTAYFVHSGQVECDDPINEGNTIIYMENSCFGLSQCFNKHLPHSTTYYAITSSVILTLNISKSEYLKTFFPDDLSYIVKELEKQAEDTKVVNTGDGQR